MAVRSQALKRGQRGQLALITALIAMPMSVAVVFAVELAALSGERSKMQAAVEICPSSTSAIGNKSLSMASSQFFI